VFSNSETDTGNIIHILIVTNVFLVPIMDGGCLSSTGRIIIDRGELKCLERNLY